MKRQPISEEKLREACVVLSLGCDRETACWFVGYPPDALRADMRRNPALELRVRRAEAGAEVAYMRNVYEAAKDPRHWRASTWWLERRAPQRYGGRLESAVTPSELDEFVDGLAALISRVVSDDADRARFLAELELWDAGRGSWRDNGAAHRAPYSSPSSRQRPDDYGKNGKHDGWSWEE